MSRGLFDRVYDGVLDTDPEYFKRKANCTGKLGIHPLLKIVAALRVLANAGSADSLDDNMEMAESTILDSLCHFVDAVDIKFGDQYLRAPTTEDVSRLLDMNGRRGFVGMLFNIDCMHWEWQNCPASLAGQFKSKEKKPTMELEAYADRDLWIWYASFWWPGSLNDINILDRSDFFDRLLRGEAPTVKFTVNNHGHNMAYCLADGIYPNWPVFLKTISEPATNKRQHYVKCQEVRRKDVERAFEVLQARWHIIAVPCKYWSRSRMAKIMCACIILHNMIVEDERDSHHVKKEDAGNSIPRYVVTRPPCIRPRSINEAASYITAIEDSSAYFRLRDDVVNHLWQMRAE